MAFDLDVEIAELRDRVGASNDAELATALGIQRSAISQWRKRGRIPEKTKADVRRLERNRAAGDASLPAIAALPVIEAEICRAMAIAFIARYSREEPTRLLHWSRQFNEVIAAAARLLRSRSAISRFQGSALGEVFAYTVGEDKFFEHDMIEELMRHGLPQ